MCQVFLADPVLTNFGIEVRTGYKNKFATSSLDPALQPSSYPPIHVWVYKNDASSDFSKVLMDHLVSTFLNSKNCFHKIPKQADFWWYFKNI